jgi:hypothetical protein
VTDAPPLVDRGILLKLLQEWLPAVDDCAPALILVCARYADAEGSFEVKVPAADGRTAHERRVTVTNQPSVLGIVDTWHRHRADTTGSGEVLVVTTAAGDSDLGWELRGQALGRKVRTVDRADLVQRRFQAPDADPRIARRPWLVDGLLAAEPSTGWRPVGGVLTLDIAAAALVAARLGIDVDRDGWDITALLDWSRRPGATERFAALDQAEHDGIAAWLTERAGPAAALLLALAAADRGRDAMPLGVVCSLAATPGVPAETAMALGGLLGGVPHRPAQLSALSSAVSGTLTRWVTEAADTRDPRDSEPGMRVLDVVHRADRLAEAAGLTDALAAHTLLPSALDHQIRELAQALTSPADPAAPTEGEVAAAEAALDVVARHELVHLQPRRLDIATMAVRLQRWLATPEPSPAGVADAISRQMTAWGWVDRALDLVWSGDPHGDGATATAYRRVHDAARARRDHLDEQFASQLATWAQHACSPQPGGCLLVEDVLATIVAPLTRQDGPAPLLLVLDAMSSAAALELGEQVQTRGWTETSPQPRLRMAAVAMLPTLTQISRTSLLTGRAATGDQATEVEGFTAFWHRHGRRAHLFHKGDLPGRAGQRISDPVMEALSSDAVVGIVLNTIDETLDHGQEGDRTGWTIHRITYLRDLLDAARSYGRPVILTSDHGHVLDRSLPGQGPTTTEGVQSARWRTGLAGPGEIEVTGPRVLAPGSGRAVLPWRESIRYTPRKAGYHGGAALAEVTVPIVVLMPDPDRLPDGWHVLVQADLVPRWWTGRGADVVAEPATGRPVAERRRRRSSGAPPPRGETLFDLAGMDVGEPSMRTAPAQAVATAATGAPTLGQRVVASEVYEAQKAFVRRPLGKQDVARVVDELVAASGTLPLATVATLVGRAGRRSEQIVTMLQRLLNVEGYEVIAPVDGGRTVRLDVAVLREQFRLGSST